MLLSYTELDQVTNSQEVVRSTQADVRQFRLTWRRIELQEVEFHELIDFHNSCLVATPVAVVRSGEDSDNVALVCPVIAIHDELMGACNSHKVVRMIELFTDVLSK